MVTARFKTERHVEALSRVEFADSDGRSEQITGTRQHPIWSLDRNSWIGLGELEEGERVAAQHGPVLVTSVEQLSDTSTVYNIEVAGEHVYQVGELGILVHNACGATGTYKGLRSIVKGSGVHVHHLIEKRFAKVLGQKAAEMASVVVNPKQHQIFTNAWRKMFPYGTDYSKLNPAQVENAAREIYANHPMLLHALGL